MEARWFYGPATSRTNGELGLRVDEYGDGLKVELRQLATADVDGKSMRCWSSRGGWKGFDVTGKKGGDSVLWDGLTR